MKTKLWLVTIIMIAAFALSACSPAALSSTAGAVPAAPASNLQPVAAAGTAPFQKRRGVIGNVADLEATLQQIYEHVNPSVVAIQVVENSGSATPACPLTIRDKACRKRKRSALVLSGTKTATS